MAYNKSAEEVRHYCRNPRCGSKLPAPVSNSREAFCTRGCHNSFCLSRCLICEGRIEQPKRGKRLICKKVKCRSALRSNSCLGRYHTSSAAKLISKEADFVGVKEPLKPDRTCRIVAGPELTASQLHCAVIGATEVVEAINRTNARHWREYNAAAEANCSIKRPDPPVNVVGGYKFPGGPVIDLAPITRSSPPPANDTAVLAGHPGIFTAQVPYAGGRMSDVTLERLEKAITMTAYVMRRHKLPQLLPTLKRLQAARDDLLVNGDPLEYAKRVLERGTIEVRVTQRRLAA